MTEFKDYFSEHSNHYAAFRPHYPSELAQLLAQLSPSTQLALDCGCGTGQLSILLAECFDHVVATDASQAQIVQAEPKDNIQYQVALAEQSGLAVQSVDLITVAQAAHWLDLPTFYNEVKRIAKPQAIVALITYGVLHLDQPEIDALLQHFYYQDIFQYWPPERKHVENGYTDFEFPFQEIVFPKVTMFEEWNFFELIGYLNTWSAVKVATQQLGHNPVEIFADQLAKEWGNLEQKRKVHWPLSGRIGRVI